MASLKSENWWTRLLDRLRGRSPNGRSELPGIGEDGLLSEPAETAEGEPTLDRPAGALTRWTTKRDQTLAKLQEGYERVTQVVEEVQKHLALQGERTERICTSLEQLARSMGDLPEASRQQTETLESIAGHLETSSARTQQLAETMGEMPKVARAQSDTLVGIKRQLDMTGEQNLVTGQTLEKLGTAISTLGEFSSAQASTLREMNAQTNQQTEALTQLLAQQSKRFTALFVVTLIVAVVAIAAVVYIVLRQQGIAPAL